MSHLLESSRLYLREVRASDVNERYLSWLNDREVNRYLETRFVPQTLESIASFVASKGAKSDEPLFAVCLNGTHEHIGNIKLGPINWVHRRGYVSMVIGEKSTWGQGYATEAWGLITEFGFRELNLNKLEAGVYLPNEGSLKSLERNGYVREGLLRQHCWLDGEYVDVVLLGLTSAEWEQTS